ncbi:MULTISPECIES: hypothetical protein [Pasteurellaceae]|uniref:Integrating conjugative element protein, PFL_4695 family n=1 Tax=Pasteurella atlantica TaxID=2827233 RepID=A0AAW8CI82_9PAST|nr:hypothetical protein [Pasteurella atlantica]MBR0573825.1 hypothetical protein [Pasteurella atlantica]MDP8039761.1 hypothetical protein [Pasteurella atlantica]MDP8041946.1 hypothetical protein [Pasteurella atlantica]MDP8044029.1 hypothetical protein [Pasteurella atlantica]MDP8046007.1 hypothetical protein [Pasteurella atlantica]
MKKLFLLIILCYQFPFVIANTETIYPSYQIVDKQVKQVGIAFIDTTKASMDWVKENKIYLRENNILVMVIGGTELLVKQLNSKYQGVLFGVEPKPKMYLSLLFKQLNINTLPYVMIQK